MLFILIFYLLYLYVLLVQVINETDFLEVLLSGRPLWYLGNVNEQQLPGGSESHSKRGMRIVNS